MLNFYLYQPPSGVRVHLANFDCRGGCNRNWSLQPVSCGELEMEAGSENRRLPFNPIVQQCDLISLSAARRYHYR